MPFEPEKITKAHVLQAIEKIESENIVLEASTGYDVSINNKLYPPKDILRYAHQIMNGEKAWYPSGGEPTNRYLKKLGFEVIKKINSVDQEYESNYWWVCQGANYNTEFDEKLIKAPDDNIHHHKRLRELQKGDCIIHYANGYVMAVSKVIKRFELKVIPGKNGNEPWLIVKVEFQKINMPIEIHDVRERLRDHTNLLPKQYSPLDKNGNVNQGYLFQFTKEAYDLLIEGIYPDDMKYYVVGTFWNDYNPQDQTDRFVTNGIWENGYEDKFIEQVKNVPEGSLIAIKTTIKQDDKMIIKALGSVYRNSRDGKTLHVQWNKDFTPFKVDYSGGYWETIKEVTNTDHIQDIFFHNYSISNTRIMTINPLNTILYGPPGTGKTYNSIDKAVEIVLGQSLDNHASNKKEFDRLRKEGQIEFVTFHQNYSYEDFMIGLRPDPDNSQLRFIPYKGVFYQLCKRARDNYEASKLQSAVKSYETLVDEMQGKISDEQPLEFKTVRGKPFWITDYSDKTLYLKKSTGSEIHTLSVSTLIDIAEGKREMVSGLSVYYYPIVEYLRANRQSTGTSEELKRYVVIIDEINRANISKVFGELITLLESDKRLDQENELKVTLPNGEINFCLPPNLYIVGTMNTADKSIALIDVALRRRFEFEGKYPNTNAIDDPSKRQLLSQLNAAVFEQKKSADYLIGHAYFMNESTVTETLQKKIIPLLTEYFSGKTKIVEDCFIGTNWRVTYNTSTYMWEINSLKI
ncbi:MAG TPA: AAA family ATPase [Cyclobacteriaceae bacterium]|jgi:DNA replication protein DnaC|nr:AAA family ATPase [Cyclobacteriaceae bacterium]